MHNSADDQSGAFGADASDAQNRNRRILPDSLSDRGNAKLFAEMYAQSFRYVPELGWHRWDGTRWQLDDEESVLWSAGEMIESMATVDPAGNFTAAALRSHRLSSLSTTGVEAMLAQAKAAPAFAMSATCLDAEPYALCTPAGPLDLRTGRVRAPDARIDLHSRRTSVAPDDIPTPKWEKFLADVFGADAEGAKVIGFIQRLIGYSITGDVGGQIVPFFCGPGGNGKSVLVEVVMKLLGDYADAAPLGLLMVHTHKTHPTEIAELHGKRLVICSEVKSGDVFDEGRFMALTGGDRLKARKIGRGYFSFSPTHKIWLVGNHHPEVRAGTAGFWRRMRLIPCVNTFTPQQEIRNLADVLISEEGPGIMKWMVDGAKSYLSGQGDLTSPKKVVQATRSYADNEDHALRLLSG
ncbi:DNA primase [Streptomyces sp. WAC 01325]|nr:DNA primase [Streptomyces sp. WAC 01325]